MRIIVTAPTYKSRVIFDGELGDVIAIAPWENTIITMRRWSLVSVAEIPTKFLDGFRERYESVGLRIMDQSALFALELKKR